MSHHPQSELKIPVGIQGLPQIIATNRRYIDKTPYITSWILNGAAATNILHRPRRLGKTLTLSVVEALYSHQKISLKIHPFLIPSGSLQIIIRSSPFIWQFLRGEPL